MPSSANEKLIALHRYWLNANVLRSFFYKSAKGSKIDEKLLSWIGMYEEGFLITETNTLMCFWYAAIYIVVEGYQGLSLRDDKIELLLKSEYLSRLKRFRNVMFHVQNEWWSPKLAEIHSNIEHVDWVQELHSELGRFLLEQVKLIFPAEKRARIEDQIRRMHAGE